LLAPAEFSNDENSNGAGVSAKNKNIVNFLRILKMRVHTKSLALTLSIIFCFLLQGCSVQSKSDCVNTGRQLTAGTNVCTVVIMSHGPDLATAEAMNMTVHIAKNCWDKWRDFIKDGNLPAPDVVSCATDAVFDFIFWQKLYHIDPAQTQTVTLGKFELCDPHSTGKMDLDVRIEGLKADVFPDLEMTAYQYDIAVERFDKAMAAYWLEHPKKGF
jgi:hypothetical protein